MTETSNNTFKKHVVNFFGGLGYFFCSIQWLWGVLLYSSWIEKLIILMNSGIDNPVVKSTPAIDSGPNIFLIIIGAIITMTMIGLTIYILIKMPSTIAKTSQNFVHKAAETSTHIVLQIQHKKETKKNRIKLTPRLIFILKIILVILPIILAITSQFVEKQMLDYHIAIYASVWLAIISTVLFTFQFVLASVLSITKTDIL